MDSKLQSLVEKLREIKKMGFVETHRTGNTGIGKTLEDLLGIIENNIQGPDWKGKYELKAQRRGTSSKITLFTLSPKLIEGLTWQTFIEKYGYIDRKGRIALKNTMYFNRNENNWKIGITSDKINLIVEDEIPAYWVKETVMSKLTSKLNNTVFVYAERKKVNTIENFHFEQAILGTNISWENFLDLIKQNKIVIEFRMHQKESGAVRDHGTGFRIKSNLLDQLFENHIDLKI